MAAPKQALTIVNLKSGMPAVEQAKRRLLESLYAPRGASGPLVKIIHGYGPSGAGGAIRTAVRGLLAQWQREGKVLSVIHGMTGASSSPPPRRFASAIHLSRMKRIYTARARA